MVNFQLVITIGGISVTFTGFTQEDFNVFTVDGLEERMSELKSKIRPKLELLGDQFAPTLASLTGDEMFFHVAKHARRSVNPPDDTWVAFANSKRGYKKLPHFQIGLWETHLFVYFALIYESPIKASYGTLLEQKAEDILSQIPNDFVWSKDHTKPDVTTQSQLTTEEFISLAKRLQEVKKAEILCGIHIDATDPILQNGQELLEKMNDTFHKLMPLYKLTHHA